LLSKENGILLPAMLLVIEFILVRTLWGSPPAHQQHQTRILVFFALILPTLVVAGYLVQQTISTGLHSPLGSRDFTIADRLLTQPRVLFEYLSNLLLPRTWYPGLFREDFPVSHGLMQPPITGFYLATLTALAALAGLGRRRVPLLSAAVLFFLVGHVLESTTIPLELFFDHRNYLPAAFLFLPLAVWLVAVPRGKFAIIPVLGLMSAMTWAHASLWGEPIKLYLHWAELNPNSARAQITAGGRLVRAGFPELALEVTSEAAARQPLEPGLQLFHLSVKSRVEGLDDNDVASALRALREGPLDVQAPRILEPIVDADVAGRGHALPYEVTVSIFETFVEQPRYMRNGDRAAFIHFQHGRLELRHGHHESACRAFALGLHARPEVGAALRVFALLASYGLYEDAHKVLQWSREWLEAAPAGGLRFDKEWYRREIGRLEANLAADTAQATVPGQTCGVARALHLASRDENRTYSAHAGADIPATDASGTADGGSKSQH
jgi:hypothetical protein